MANRAVCARNLKSSGSAALLYRAEFGFFPPNWTWGKQGEAPANYNKYETRSGWDGPQNWVGAKNPLFEDFIKNLDIFVCPSNVNTVLVDQIEDLDENQPLPGDKGPDFGWKGVDLKGYHLRYDNGNVFYFYEWNHNLSKILGYGRIEGGGVRRMSVKPPVDEKWHIVWYTRNNPSEPGRTYVYYETDDPGSGPEWSGSNHPSILSGTQSEKDSGGNIVFADNSVRWMNNEQKLLLEGENIGLNRDKGTNNNLKYGVYANPWTWDALPVSDQVHQLQTRD